VASWHQRVGLLSAEELLVVVDVAVAVVVHLHAAASGAGQCTRASTDGAAAAVVVGCKKAYYVENLLHRVIILASTS